MADEGENNPVVTAEESANEAPAADVAASTAVPEEETMQVNHQDADGQVKGADGQDADEAEQQQRDEAGPAQIPSSEDAGAASAPIKSEPAEPSIPRDPRLARAQAAQASSPTPPVIKAEPQSDPQEAVMTEVSKEATPAPAEDTAKTAPLQPPAHKQEAMDEVNNFLASVQQQAASSSNSATPTDLSTPSARRAHLLARIETEPRDSEAWLTLLADSEARLAEGESIDQVRETYERFFKVYPNAARQWQAYIDLELSLSNFAQVEQLFTRCLRTTPSVSLWKAYLNYTRRVNPLPAPSAGDDEGERGRVRKLIEEAYDFAVRHVGMSRDAGDIWMEYMRFVKEREAKTSWLQGQKMDDMRRIFQRVVGVPVANVEQIWREYDQFENVSVCASEVTY